MINPDALISHLLDESHLIFRDSCRRFAEREIKPHAVEWEEAESFPIELYRKAGDAGIMGPGMPEEYGGGGGDMLHSLLAT